MIVPYYEFRIQKDEYGAWHLVPLFRYLNNEWLNCIFESPDSCKIQLIDPSDSTYGYLGYALQYNDFDNESGMIILSSSTGLIPWGIGRARGSKDAFIFRLSQDNLFETFIFPGMADQSYQLLMSIQDGTGGYREVIDRVLDEVERIKQSGDNE